MQGEEKASLGTRYLINYIDNRNSVYLDVVKNCITEVKFYAILMHFCNNMDELFENIPDGILTRVFECRDIVLKNIFNSSKNNKFNYGNGIKLNVSGKYRWQLKLIRNNLAHGNYTFDGKIITITDNNYKVVFDIKWLESLTLCILANQNYLIKKGITDYGIISLVNMEGKTAMNIEALRDLGYLQMLKIECITDDIDVILKKFPKLEALKNRITFDALKTIVITTLKSQMQRYTFYDNSINAFLKAFRDLSKAFAGIFKLSLVPIDSKALKDSNFLNLALDDACDYLTNEANALDKVMNNTINLKSILELLDKIANNIEFSSKDEYSINNYRFFLLRVYGYILFKNYLNKRNSEDIFLEFWEYITGNYVHAHKVWQEYIKKINNAILVLKDNGQSSSQINYWEDKLQLYKGRIQNYNNGNKQIFNNFRNSLTHGLVEERGSDLVFYGEEPKIFLPKLKKKTKEIVEVEFQNKDRIFELRIDKDIYLQLLDRLYESCGIEIKVNIAKYRKRKNYLES